MKVKEILTESIMTNIVYHGSPSDFDEFDPYASMDTGFYFTDDLKLAASFSRDEDGEFGTVYSAKLIMNNPATIELHGAQQPSQEEMKQLFLEAKQNQNDSVILLNVREFNGIGTQYVVFNSNQIKIIKKIHGDQIEQILSNYLLT